MRVYGGPDWRSRAAQTSQRWQLQTTVDDLVRERSTKFYRETSLGDLSLPPKVVSCLEDNEIFTVDDLLTQSSRVIQVLGAFDLRAIHECCAALRQLQIESPYCRLPVKRQRSRTRGA